MDAVHSTTTITQVVVQEPNAHKESSCSLVQHDVLEITLHGPTLVLTIIAIIVSIQILQPSFTCTLLAFAPLPWIVRNDYKNFINLGPGGTPSTFLGYLKIAFLRLFALSDPYTPASISEKIYPVIGFYQRSHSWLPERSGPRPKIAGIAPQRQIDQPGDLEMYLKLRKALENLAVQHPDSFRTATSCFEKKGLALFAQSPINETCRGEICHVHHSDRSMHMNLHPDDAKIVLQKGWGERHPLARGGWMKQYVPREFLMIYAPRDRSELEVVCRIIEAAGFWVSGERFKLEVENETLLGKEVVA
ncbi:hypothetical protein BDZ45DRAFT_411788 [Acephala macrosclerotiorum]|nr:hypothetical protein BDZ45DRAFT_411788 [Acephala macrosclerotiorum]